MVELVEWASRLHKSIRMIRARPEQADPEAPELDLIAEHSDRPVRLRPVITRLVVITFAAALVGIDDLLQLLFQVRIIWLRHRLRDILDSYCGSNCAQEMRDLS